MFKVRSRSRASWPEASLETAYGSHRVWIEDERRVRVWGRFTLPAGTREGTVLLADYGSGFELLREPSPVEIFDASARPMSISRATEVALGSAVALAVCELRAKSPGLFAEGRAVSKWNKLRDIEDRLRAELARVDVLIDAWLEGLPAVDGAECARHAIVALVEGLLGTALHRAPLAFPCLRAKDEHCKRARGPHCVHCRTVGRLERTVQEVRRRMDPEVQR